MSEQEPEAESEGSIGQSASTGGLARRIVFHWNQAVKETGDGTYPIIIAKFAERIAFDEREACAQLAMEHECGGDDDVVCQHQNCGLCIAGAIRMRSNV